MELFIKRLDELDDIASQILSFAAGPCIFLFYGDMGAGKTTLIKAICGCLGVSDIVTSPTFSIVNEYAGAENKIYHFDFYRLKDQTEALDMGYEEYFSSAAWCFIEWPEKIAGLLPRHYVSVRLQVAGNEQRRIIIEKI